MLTREDLEKLLADLRRRREEAEAEAGQAAERLARLASGLTPLAELDPDQLRATSDTFADSVQRMHDLGEFARDLRALLM
jgi:hypothetical protein